MFRGPDNGRLSLDGLLEIVLLDGFIPSPTDTFTILQATGGVVGGFDAAEGGVLRTNVGWFTLEQTGSTLSLGQFVRAAVPEPGTAALLGAGVLVVGMKTPTRGAGGRSGGAGFTSRRRGCRGSPRP